MPILPLKGALAAQFSVSCTAIRPKKYDLSAVVRGVATGYTKAEKYAMKLLKGSVETWRRKPTFQVERSKPARSEAAVGYGVYQVITVSTTDTPFVWVDRGVPPHPIMPRQLMARTGAPRFAALKFRPGYREKSRPRSLESFPGGHYGPFRYAAGIFIHPGVEPRHITTQVQIRVQKVLPTYVDKAINKELEKGLKQ